MRVRIWKGDRPSAGARALAKAMGVKVLRAERSRFRPREDDVLLNWGTTYTPAWPGQIINEPEAVATAVNKLRAFHHLHDHGCAELLPDWTESTAHVLTWQEHGHWAMARTILNGSEGRGLVVIAPDQPVIQAPLYTKYVKGREEYRLHVVGGRVIDRQMKRRRADLDGPANTRVRNLANGWVFCREDVPVHEQVDHAAIAAVGALGLDFGAVDIKRNDQNGRVFVLEVNTAPGLEGTTLETYARALALYVQGVEL